PDDPDAEEVVLRCGLDRPHEFVQNSPLQVVGDVEWLEVDGAADGLESSTWTAVDRGVYIALTLPSGSGSGPIQRMSETIAETMPAQDLDPAPARAPGAPNVPGIETPPGPAQDDCPAQGRFAPRTGPARSPAGPAPASCDVQSGCPERFR